MLIHGIAAGIGLLFIIPMLQIMGLDIGMPAGIEGNSELTAFANRIFDELGLEVTLANVLISYVVIVSVFAAVRYQLSVQTTRVQHAYITHLRCKLYRLLLHSHWPFIAERKMSDFIHCLSSQVQSVGSSANLMLTLLSQILLSVVMLVIVLLLSWEMTLLALLGAATLLAILLPFNRIIYGSGKRQLLGYKSIFQMLSEQLASLKMIKSYTNEKICLERMDETSHQIELQHLRLARFTAATQLVYLIGAVVVFGIFFYVSQTFFAMPLATLLLLLVIFSRILPQFSAMQRNYQQLMHKVPAFNDIRQMENDCRQVQEAAFFGSALQLKHSIRLTDLSFHYPNSNQNVFENLNITIQRNQTVALTGPSGSGKTTLADLLAGLYEPSSGQVWVDDQPLNRDTRIAWRKSIAYVNQEVYLFHDTVRANLSWVTEGNVTDVELWRVLRLAAADQFVALLPDGLDTQIGDQGIKLSGGERQRLALARALLTSPQLLILDEATSALDHDREQQIQLALQQLQGSLTIVIIAHRKATIAQANQQIDLSQLPRQQTNSADLPMSAV